MTYDINISIAKYDTPPDLVEAALTEAEAWIESIEDFNIIWDKSDAGNSSLATGYCTSWKFFSYDEVPNWALVPVRDIVILLWDATPHSHLTSDASAGQKIVNVADGSIFSPGEDILIGGAHDFTHDDTTWYGIYEINEIDSISVNQLTMVNNLSYNFTTSTQDLVVTRLCPWLGATWPVSSWTAGRAPFSIISIPYTSLYANMGSDVDYWGFDVPLSQVICFEILNAMGAWLEYHGWTRGTDFKTCEPPHPPNIDPDDYGPTVRRNALDTAWATFTAEQKTYLATDKSSAVGAPGHIWIEGTTLHWLDSTGVERSKIGTKYGATGVVSGHLWTEGASAIHYIDSAGDERYILPDGITLVGGTQGQIGQMWVEGQELHWTCWYSYNLYEARLAGV